MDAVVEVKRKRRGPGRPNSLFTEEAKAKIISGIRVGMTFKDAALNAGVSEATYHNWMRQGREGKKPYVEFYEACEKAIQEAKAYHLRMVNKHAEGGIENVKKTVERDSEGKIVKTIEVTEKSAPNLKASLWILERRFPEEFGPRQRVDVGNKDENPFQVSLFGQAVIPGSDDSGIEDTEE